MKAILLCAGRGGRLQSLTRDRPKCLLPFGGRPLLERALESFRGAGVPEAVLVTGYRKELIEEFVRERSYGGVRFVENPDYADTNTAVSLRLALERMDDDCVLVNGDVLFDPAILADLLAHPGRNGVVVDADMALDSEEVKVITAGEFVERIGKDLDPRLCRGEAIGLYKIGRPLIGDLLRVYRDLEARGERGHFFEKGFDVVGGAEAPAERRFGLVYTAGRPWVEIDTPEDYAYAERDIVGRIRD